MSTDSDPQLPLPFDPVTAITRRANQISKKASKERRLHLPVLQTELIADRGFNPVEGVPRTRADCPTARPCPHVRCRHHLFLETTEHRAGRPGLSSVPRDANGCVLPVSGKAGTDRPGTTLRPGWLRYRLLELERECKAYVHDGELHEVRHGTLDYWLRYLRMGEPVLVFDDDTVEVVARAELTQDGLKMDRALPAETFMVVLTRVRDVSSCALDLAREGHPMSNEEVGSAVARHRTLVAREVKRAAGRLKAVGTDLRDLIDGRGSTARDSRDASVD